MNDAYLEFIRACEEVLECDDAHLSLALPTIQNTLMSIMAGPQGQRVIEAMVEEFLARNYDYEQAEQAIMVMKKGAVNEILALKEKYPSEVKHEILDITGAAYENIFDDILVAFEEKLDAIPIIKVQLLHPNAVLPTYAHPGDQGADIYAVEDVVLPAHSHGNLIYTGLAAVIPTGWALAIRPRSGMSLNTGMRIANSPGTIDELYRKEIGVIADNISGEDIIIHAGDRIAQFILEKNYHGKFETIPDISDYSTDRGEGFGSSGK